MQAAEMLDRPLDQTLAVVGIKNIGGDGVRRAGLGGGVDLKSGLLQSFDFRGRCCQHHLAARLSQRLSHRPA